MKLLILSDIHLEFHGDGGKAFLSTYENVDHDVAVIAGDICDNSRLKQSLSLISKVFNRVVYVSGNHEAWGSSISRTVAEIHEYCNRYSNISYLEQQGICIEGTWFHGCSLWFPYDINERYERKYELEAGMTDFMRILNFRDEVGEYNQKGADYLRRCVGMGDIVVTHHLPSYKCVDPKFKTSAYNRFFVGDVHDLYATRSPLIHIFGHTHESVRMNIGKTEMICNPYGYQDYEVNRNFRNPMVIEI